MGDGRGGRNCLWDRSGMMAVAVGTARRGRQTAIGTRGPTGFFHHRQLRGPKTQIRQFVLGAASGRTEAKEEDEQHQQCDATGMPQLRDQGRWCGRGAHRRARYRRGPALCNFNKVVVRTLASSRFPQWASRRGRVLLRGVAEVSSAPRPESPTSTSARRLCPSPTVTGAGSSSLAPSCRLRPDRNRSPDPV